MTHRFNEVHRLLLLTGFLLAPSLSLSQATTPNAFAPAQRVAVTGAHSEHQVPCWKQVGISKSAMGQRRAIERNARAQVESVCTDTSLTPKEKREKIKDIHQQTCQQISAIIQPQQLENLKACNAERGGRHPGRTHIPHAGGPCAEASSGPSTAIPEEEAPAGNASKPKQE